MADRATLEAQAEELRTVIATGAARVKSDERDVSFRSVDEMRAALREIEGRIAALDGARRTRVIRPVMRRGI